MIPLHEIRRQIGGLPPVADVEEPRVAAALGELARLSASLDEAARHEGAAEKKFEEAKRADRTALAAAIKRGGKDPGKTKLEAAGKALEDARRRREASEEALGGAFADVIGAVEASRVTWLETLAERQAEQEKWVAEAALELERS